MVKYAEYAKSKRDLAVTNCEKEEIKFK